MIDRKTNLGKVMEDRFITKVLTEESQDMNQEININMAGFSSATNKGRSFIARDNVLSYTHPKLNRFIDMKVRNTKSGQITKKSHQVHNAILFGYANNMVSRISYGFTQSVKDEMMKLDGTKI